MVSREVRKLSTAGKFAPQRWSTRPGRDALHSELPREKSLRKRDEATTDKDDGLQEAHRPNSQSHKGHQRLNAFSAPCDKGGSYLA